MPPARLFTSWARTLSLTVAAVGLVALLPAVGTAEVLTFRNDTNAPLVIQGASVVRGQLRADQPVSMLPGARARINLPGNKLITIYHAKLPNRPLYQGTIQGGSDDQFFSIQSDTVLGRVKLERKKPPAGMMAGPH
ncbi:MAG TPA: hypothetical protein VJ739_09235 [Gemmataceae bacterium]|nr:hypothetical protein [Gemmataceae bacterium]